MDNYEQKLAAAKQWLGDRWVLHPRNRVQKMPNKSVLLRSR